MRAFRSSLCWFLCSFLVLVAALAASACKKESSEKHSPIGPDCRRAEVPQGAILQHVSVTGMTGEKTTTTVYDDGRVVETVAVAPGQRVPERTVHTTAERVAKLDADLAASGLFSEKEGCWKIRGEGADVGGAVLAVRHGQTSYTYGASGATPAAVSRAFEVTRAFEAEIARARGALDAGVPLQH